MILELKNINLSFTKQKDAVRLLHNLNLSVQEGKITALIGGNGTGKTTLFNIISGLQDNYTGKVFFRKEPISSLSSVAIAQRGIGRLFQGSALFPDLSLLDNIRIASGDRTGEFPLSKLINRKKVALKETEKKQEAIQILKDLFGENNKYLTLLDQMGSDFSYGEQRLISLARLFMGNHNLFLLDEPTAGVNPNYFPTIKLIMQKMIDQHNSTILLIEHNMHFVREVADHCAFINEGAIQYFGSPEEVLINQQVRNSYLGI